MNKKWEKIEAILKAKAIKALSTKIVICDDKYNHDLYLKLGWADSRWVWVDITVSRFTGVTNEYETSDMEHLRRSLMDTNRRLIELVCVHATELLQSGERTLKDIVHTWRGTQFAPAGICESIRTKVNEAKVTSVLDASAKLIEQRVEQWEEKFRQEDRMDEEYLEGLIVECWAECERNPGAFTDWEKDFLASLKEKHDMIHLSEKEIDKLEEIHKEKDCG